MRNLDMQLRIQLFGKKSNRNGSHVNIVKQGNKERLSKKNKVFWNAKLTRKKNYLIDLVNMSRSTENFPWISESLWAFSL